MQHLELSTELKNKFYSSGSNLGDIKILNVLENLREIEQLILLK